jgi:hypothetical protein
VSKLTEPGTRTRWTTAVGATWCISSDHLEEVACPVARRLGSVRSRTRLGTSGLDCSDYAENEPVDCTVGPPETVTTQPQPQGVVAPGALWLTNLRFIPLEVLTAYAVTAVFELVTPIISAPGVANAPPACMP